MTETIEAQLKPVSSGFAHVNGINLYREIFIISPEVRQVVGKFLADPLTNVPAGAVAAPQVAPAAEQA